MKLMIQLPEAGWCEATLVEADREVKMAISYIGDGIGEMAGAAVALLRGERSARFAFQDEPGEHAFELKRGMDDQLRIEVFENRRNFSHRMGERVLEIECAVLDFVGQVFSNLHKFKTEAGETYRKRWGHDFPEEAYEYLRKAF
jgi:hypothetical protein